MSIEQLFNLHGFMFFSEIEMQSKMEELNETISDLRKKISSLEQRIAKEESEKLVSCLIEYHKGIFLVA